MVTSMEASQRPAAHALQVEIPTVAAGEGGLQAVLDTAAWANTKILDSKVDRIPPKAVAAMWEVHRVWEILLSTVAWVPGYYENPVTQKRSSHACLIIEILG
jgi:hypothetical protein